VPVRGDTLLFSIQLLKKGSTVQPPNSAILDFGQHVFASWSRAAEILQGLGAKPIASDPMPDYWLRMAAGAFTLVGGWYLVLMLWPRKFHAAIP